ncbi:MAG: bacillithiol system redox-active protein YtxJ [Cruoricaptor ignavus]|nr:bacillithiol system redox-active protein YtxJ [Cruoricaptor ignavus]
MSLFSQFFGGKNTGKQKSDFWKDINSEKNLDEIIARSAENRVVVFKHSTRCFISKTVLKNFEKEVENQDFSNNHKVEFYYLDLLEHRGLSNKIAEVFEVRHQSPQLIVIENGKAVKDASHQSISLSLVL